jgi:hypothetical protein
MLKNDVLPNQLQFFFIHIFFFPKLFTSKRIITTTILFFLHILCVKNYLSAERILTRLRHTAINFRSMKHLII